MCVPIYVYMLQVFVCLDLDNDRHLAVEQVSINQGTCEITSRVCTCSVK